jgi:hypothetical protein
MLDLVTPELAVPRARAATAGNSLRRSGVAVSIIEIRSSLSMAFCSRIDRISSSTEASRWSRSSLSSWVAPRMARTARVDTADLLPATCWSRSP